MIIAEFGTAQVLWSMVWFSLFFLWWWMVFVAFADILGSKHLSGWGKAMWSVGIIVLPFLGVFLYLIVNGDEMSTS
jgi:hypothetical protein